MKIISVDISWIWRKEREKNRTVKLRTSLRDKTTIRAEYFTGYDKGCKYFFTQVSIQFDEIELKSEYCK